MTGAHAPTGTRSPRLARVGFPAALLGLVFVAFGPSLSAGFVNWDDEAAILQTHEWRGLGAAQLEWMFTTNWMGPYQPLAWLSYAFDHAAVGLNSLAPTAQAPRYHLTNVVFHAVAALFVYLAAVRLAFLARPAWREDHAVLTRFAAFFGASVFALHPLRAESVAWVTERRDVVSGAFLALALWLWTFYLERAGSPRRLGRGLGLGAAASAAAVALFFLSVSLAEPTRLTLGPLGIVGLVAAVVCWLGGAFCAGCATGRAFYVAVAVCFLAALLGKGLALVLPVWFLVLDAWPFGRVRREHVLAAVLEKAPLLAASLVFGVIAGWGQRAIPGVIANWTDHTWAERVLQAGFGLVFYVHKTLVPVELSPLVALPDELSASDPRFWMPWLVVASAVLLLAWQRRRVPALVAAVVGYGVAIAPVLGLTQTGPQLVADRYSYLACLPFALLCAGSLPWAAERFAGKRAAFVVLPLAALAALVPLTRAQAAVWTSTETLWRHAASIETQSALQRALFAIDRAQGLPDRADRENVLRSSIVIVEEAVKHFQRPLLYSGLAYSYQLLWELDPPRRQREAELSLQCMLQAERLARARGEWNLDYAYNLGTAYFNVGRIAESVPHLQEVAAARQQRFGARFSLGFALLRNGDLVGARRELEAAVALEPGHVNAWGNLAMTAEKSGDRERALESYRTVLALEPNHPTATARLRALIAGS